MELLNEVLKIQNDIKSFYNTIKLRESQQFELYKITDFFQSLNRDIEIKKEISGKDFFGVGSFFIPSDNTTYNLKIKYNCTEKENEMFKNNFKHLFEQNAKITFDDRKTIELKISDFNIEWDID